MGTFRRQLFIAIVTVVCGLFFASNVHAAAQWVNDPTDCVHIYDGVNCAANIVCGYNSVACYNPASLSAPAGTANSVTQYSGSFGAGYIMNCLADRDSAAPYCDNSTAMWCNASTTCSGYYRYTTCAANKWSGDSGAATCGTCQSGYNDCNADGLSCEIHNGDDCTTGGGIPGHYLGCSGLVGNCIPEPQHFITGIKAEFSTSSPLLWGNQIGAGDLVKLTTNNAATTSFVVNNIGHVGIGTTTPLASAILDINSTDSGVLLPRLTNAQRGAIGTLTEGLLIYNSDSNQFEYYSTSSWKSLGAGGSSIESDPVWMAASTSYALSIHTHSAADITSGVLGIAYGGTGTSTAPSLGQLLMGNASGGYNLVSTSSLVVGSSTYSNTAGTSTYSSTAGTSTYSSTAGTSTYSSTAGTSTYSNTAGTSTYAETAGTSTYATVAGSVANSLVSGNGIVSFTYNGASVATVTVAFAGSGVSNSAARSDHDHYGVYASSTHIHSAGDITSGILAIANGGTGTSTAPTLGQLLMGNASGGYDLVPTSSLGIVGAIDTTTSPAGNNGEIQFNDNGVFGASSSLYWDNNLGYLSVGDNYTFAKGAYAFTQGMYSLATGTNSIAMGVYATANNDYAVAIGFAPVASGDYSLALGRGAQASGTDSVALGNLASAGNSNSVAIGYQTISSGVSSVAIGNNAQATGQTSVAIGQSVTSSGMSSFVAGYNNNSGSNYSATFGQGNISTLSESSFIAGQNNVLSSAGYSAVFGYGNTSTGQYALISGRNNDVSGGYAAAIGYGNIIGSSAGSAAAFGNSNYNNADGTLTSGAYNVATGAYSTALGYYNTSSASGAFSAGRYNTASGQDSVALGYSNTSSAFYSFSLGASNNITTASNNGSGAIGRNNYLNGAQYGSVAIGLSNAIGGSGDYGAIAMGSSSYANNNTAIAIGTYTSSTGISSVALGYGLTVSGGYSFGVNVSTTNNPTISTANVISLMGGNVGIGDVSPLALLTVGSGDLFRVDSSGNLIRINNVPYSWPGSQGAADTILQNNGSGTLTWVNTSSLGFATSSHTHDTSAIVSGILPIVRGGTNSSTIGAAGSVTYSNGTAYMATAVGTSGQILRSNAAGAPTWTNTSSLFGTMAAQNSNAVSITGGTITGITDLAVADGGTGASTLAAGGILYGNGTSAIGSSVGTVGQILLSGGAGAPTWVASTTFSSSAHTHATLSQGTGIASFSYNGSAAVTVGLTTSGVTAATYGSASAVSVIAVDTYGRITSASTSSIAINGNQITSGLVSLTYGGTNRNMTAVNGGVVWTDADSMEVSAAGTTGQILQSNGTAAPTWVSTSSLGFASSSGSNSYIQNQNLLDQVASYRISGVGTMSTATLGTPTPEFKLTIAGDGGIIAKGTYGSGTTLSTSGAGTRLIWYPQKAAFRAGYVNGTQWNDANMGPYSTAFGNSNTAIGWYSFAAGVGNSADGNGATVFGDSSTVNGQAAFAAGISTQAINNAAIALGSDSIASGDRSVAIGYYATADVSYAKAFGNYVTSSASNAIALGNYMTVSGDYSFGVNVSAVSVTLSQANTIALMGGNVGINTTTPGYALTVSGGTNLTGALRANGNAGTSGQLLQSTGTGISWVNTSSLGFASSSGSNSYIQNQNSADQSANFRITGTGTLAAVGIGTTTPSMTLDVYGNINIPQTSGATRGGIYMGGERYIFSSSDRDSLFIGNFAGNFSMSGSSNTAIGSYALQSNGSGVYNVAVGTEALSLNSSGNLNTAIGDRALAVNTTGQYNTAMGYQAMRMNDTGNSNTAIGGAAMLWNDSGNKNVALGELALTQATSSDSNIAIGYSALYGTGSGSYNIGIGESALYSNGGSENISIGMDTLHNNSGNYNLAVGFQAMATNTTGYANVALGYKALSSNIDGYRNVAIGENTLDANITGFWNVAIGAGTLGTATSGDSNVAVGYSAMDQNKTGSNNVAIGMNSLDHLTTGIYNTAIGNGAGDTSAFDIESYNTLLGASTVISTGVEYATAIGYSASASVSSSIFLGTASWGQVYMPGEVGSIPNTLCITTGGNVYPNNGACTTSDVRLKKDVTTISASLDVLGALKQLRGVYYFWDTTNPDMAGSTNSRQLGMIAQEVQAVFPELVNLDISSGYYMLDYEKYTGFLTEVAKAQQNIIEPLDTAFDVVTSTRSLTIGSVSEPYTLNLTGNVNFLATAESFASGHKLSFSTSTIFESSVANEPGARAFTFNATNFNTSTSDNYLLSLRSNNSPVFSVSANGDVHSLGNMYAASAVLGTSTNPGDLAEKVDINPSETVEAGDVMMVDPTMPDRYQKVNTSYEPTVAGVISTNPTIIVGNGKTSQTAPLAMVGRVPVKYSEENGPIQRGDLLVAASIPGRAMKYDPKNDNSRKVVGIVGIALDSSSNSTDGKILTLIRTGWVYNKTEAAAKLEAQVQVIATETGVDISSVEAGDLTVGGTTSGGTISYSGEGNLDLANNAILNVSAIIGKNNKWTIDEFGLLTAKITTSQGEKSVYGMTSENAEITLSGTGTLQMGEVVITFAADTQEIIDSSAPIKVVPALTSGDCQGIFVSEKSAQGFTVKELNNGMSSASFDWIVIAKRKININNDIVVDQPESPSEDISQPWSEPTSDTTSSSTEIDDGTSSDDGAVEPPATDGETTEEPPADIPPADVPSDTPVDVPPVETPSEPI